MGMIKLRPVAHQKLRDLAEEISRKRGVKSIAWQRLSRPLSNWLTGWRAWTTKVTIAGFDAGNPDRRIFYGSREGK